MILPKCVLTSHGTKLAQITSKCQQTPSIIDWCVGQNGANHQPLTLSILMGFRKHRIFHFIHHTSFPNTDGTGNYNSSSYNLRTHLTYIDSTMMMAWWWPTLTRNRVITSHGNDLVFPQYSILNFGRTNSDIINRHQDPGSISTLTYFSSVRNSSCIQLNSILPFTISLIINVHW